MAARNIIPPNSDGLHFDTKERICPICGKNFIPAPYHSWKVGTCDIHNDRPEWRLKLVCSYSCMRKWEKAHGRAK